MTESTSRFTLAAACGLGTFAVIAALFLGLRGAQLPAAFFLLLAVAGCAVSWVAYKRYTRLRNERWRKERAHGEEELNQMLNHTRMNIIVDHVTGPLRAEQTFGDAANPSPEAQQEHPLADS